MPLTPSTTRRWTCVAALAATLSACGGGSDTPDTTPQVQDIAATPLRYSQAATFTLTGSHLVSAGVEVSVSGCSGLQLSEGGTEERQTVTCRVTSVDGVQVSTKDADGTPLLSRRFDVPMPQVQLETSLGAVTLEFHPREAPNTVLNFLGHVNAGFYDGTLFHRVIPAFVAQGGGFVRNATGLAARNPLVTSLPLESNKGLSNRRGTLAMARATAPDSATSQFYVNLQDNTGLDYVDAQQPGYAVFGRVTQGMDVFDRMAQQPTGNAQGLQNVPLQDITLVRATQTR